MLPKYLILYYLFVLFVVNYVTTLKLSWKFKTWTQNLKFPKPKLPNLFQIIEYYDRVIDKIEDLNRLDFSAGAYELSKPDVTVSTNYPSLNEMNNLFNTNYSLNSSLSTDFDDKTIIYEGEPVRRSPLLRIHRFGKKAIKNVPDNALLGILILIASELLQREVSYKSPNIPLAFRDIANTTVFELDSKLEKLSELKWNFDPFIQNELENLQSQPLEAIDKYLVAEVLPRVDKELIPILNKLTTDSSKVKEVVKSVKDIVQVSAYLLSSPNEYSKKSNASIETSIIQGVDYVGRNIEDVVREWNGIIEDISEIAKSDSLLSLLPASVLAKTEIYNPQALPKFIPNSRLFSELLSIKSNTTSTSIMKEEIKVDSQLLFNQIAYSKFNMTSSVYSYDKLNQWSEDFNNSIQYTRDYFSKLFSSFKF